MIEGNGSILYKRIQRRYGGTIIASFERNGNTLHFSIEELKQICDAVKKKANPSMEAKAEELFPGRDPICYENIHIWEGPGRAFKHNGDDYVRPMHTINAHPLIGVRMALFLICVLSGLAFYSMIKGIFDIVACVPYFSDHFDECKARLIQGFILLLVPVGAILLILYDLMTFGT